MSYPVIVTPKTNLVYCNIYITCVLQLSETLARSARIDELLHKQDTLKREMTEAKRCLMVPSGSWNFECRYY